MIIIHIPKLNKANNIFLSFFLERATKSSNKKIDTAAMIAFSGFVQRDPECAPLAAKCILAKIHSMQEWEALQALHVYIFRILQINSNLLYKNIYIYMYFSY